MNAKSPMKKEHKNPTLASLLTIQKTEPEKHPNKYT